MYTYFLEDPYGNTIASFQTHEKLNEDYFENLCIADIEDEGIRLQMIDECI